MESPIWPRQSNTSLYSVKTFSLISGALIFTDTGPTLFTCTVSEMVSLNSPSFSQVSADSRGLLIVSTTWKSNSLAVLFWFFLQGNYFWEGGRRFTTAKSRSPITLHVAPVSKWHYNSVKYESSRSEKITLALNCLPSVSTLETSSILKSGSSLSVACDLYVLSFLIWACFTDDIQMHPLYPLYLSFYRAIICHLVVSLDCPRRWCARLLGFDPVSWNRAV